MSSFYGFFLDFFYYLSLLWWLLLSYLNNWFLHSTILMWNRDIDWLKGTFAAYFSLDALSKITILNDYKFKRFLTCSLLCLLTLCHL